ncbi:MAG: type II secretion system protein GspG [Kiritimatiellia bacterium]
MIPPKSPDAPKRKRKNKQLDDTQPEHTLPYFRPGKNPTILGGIILLFIVLGSLLTSQLSGPAPETIQQVDPIARAFREIQALTTALERFHADTGRFPTAAEGLRALVHDPGTPGWSGHYVNLIQPDPWKTPYRYSLTATGPEVRSAGPDRTFETDADIYHTATAAQAHADTPSE